MRTLSTAAQTTVAQKMGNKPITIVGFQLVDSTTEILYADKEIVTPDNIYIKGDLLDISAMDDIVNLTMNASSAELAITIDDTDGSFKALFDTYDLAKKTVTVYQWFEGLNFTEKFITFRGEIYSDVVWSEGDRTFKITVVSKLQDNQIGFAPVQGQFGFVTPELAGTAWPLVFGTCGYVPGVKVIEAPRGVLENPIGFVDPTLIAKYNELVFRQTVLIDQFNVLSLMYAMTDTIAPPPGAILTDYLNTIISEDSLRRKIQDNLIKLALKDDQIKKETVKQTKQNLKNNRNQLENTIVQQTQQMRQLMVNKDGDQQQAQAAAYALQLKEQIIQNQSNILTQELALSVQMIQILGIEAYQATYQLQEFGVYLGERFPQGVSTDIIINDMRIRGSFSGTAFTPTVYGLPKYTNIGIVPPPLGSRLDAFYITDPAISLKGMYCWCNDGIIVQVTEQIGTMCIFQLKELSPTDIQNNQNPQSPQNLGNGQQQVSSGSIAYLQSGQADLPLDDNEVQVISSLENTLATELLLQQAQGVPPPPTYYEFTTFNISHINEVAPIMLLPWLNQLTHTQIEALPDSGMWYAEAGSTVYRADDYQQTYVVNLLPSSVLNVFAYRTVNNKKTLTAVPTNYYTKNENKSLGPFHLTMITLVKPLSEYVGEQWEDQIYVTLVSSVGPNTVDILEYLITTYGSGITYDATSFNYVKGKIDNYPSHFGLFDLRELVQTLQEIAWQARCALYLKDNVFYIKYLSETPTSVATISESDIEAGSLGIKLSPTEDVYTKLVASWKTDYAQQQPNQLILQHNVKKYGLIENDYDYYIYNIESLVEKSSTFWMIRYSNTWKIVTFKTFLHNLKVETLDAVTLHFNTPYICNTDVLGIVQKAEYNSSDNTIDMEVWIPVKAGTLDVYDLAYPSSVSISTIFPTPQEVFEGMAGGGPPGNNVAGQLTSVGSTSGGGGGGGGSGSSSRPGDWGRQFPSDAGDTKPDAPVNNINPGNVNTPVQQPVNVGPNKIGNPTKLGINASAALAGRQAFIGTVLEQSGQTPDGKGIYTIITDPTSGQWIQATQIRTPLNHTLESGMGVIVVRSHLTNEWLIQGQVHFDWVMKLSLKSMTDNALVCKDLFDNKYNVLKPYEHARSSFDGISGMFDDGKVRHWLDHNYRYASDLPADNGDYFQWMETLSPQQYYVPAGAVDDTTANPLKPGYPEIIAVQCEDAITSGLDGVAKHYWVSTNPAGASWQKITKYIGQVKEDFTTNSTSGPDIEILSVEDPDIQLFNSEGDPLIARDVPTAPYIEPGVKLVAGTKVLLELFEDHEDFTGLKITKVMRKAKIIRGLFTADLNPTDGSAQLTVTEFADGGNPGNTVTVDNIMGFKSDFNKLGQAYLRDDDTYELFQAQCSSRT